MITLTKPQADAASVAAHRITISTPPRIGLPKLCFTMFKRHGLAIRSLSILQDDRRRDRQSIEIVTEPCMASVAAAVGEALRTDEAPQVQRL